VESYV